MGMLGTIGSDFDRMREIARVMAAHGFAPTLRRIPSFRRAALDADSHAADDPAPVRFARMLEELGPTFVKVGQILSTRGDLLPPPFIDALSRLQDSAKPVAFDAIVTAIEDGLGASIDVLFAHVDPTPLASASMAQVHTATLHDGRDVVVKVQRPGIAASIERDANILALLARLLELVVEEASHYEAANFVDEFHRGLAEELDFGHEARNLSAFAAHNSAREGLHVPTLLRSRSSATVLTMERIHGGRITERLEQKPAAEREAAVRRLVDAAFDHVFVDGLFHADPHPGNVLFSDTGDIAFIDFGLMGHIARDTQDRLLTLLIALALRDVDTLSRTMIRLGNTKGRIDLHAFKRAIHRLLERYGGLAIGDVASSSVMTDLIDLSLTFGLTLPQEFALLAKAAISLEGIVRRLTPDLDITTLVTQKGQALASTRFDPRQWESGGLRTALQLASVAQDLPTQLNQSLFDLERGQLQVGITSKELAQLNATLRGVGMAIFSGMLSAALLLGGIDALAKHTWTAWGVPLIPAVAFALSGSLFGVAFAWYVFGGRVPKLSLSAWRPRARLRAPSPSAGAPPRISPPETHEPGSR